MADRVHPSSKPIANGTTAGPTPAAAATAAAPPTINPTATKPQLRQPYRPQPQYRNRHHRRSNRNICCCCCFWTILLVLAIGLLAAIAAAAVYVLYHPNRPQFTIDSLRIAKLNLTTSPDTSSSHLKTLLNLTISSENPNSHLTFFYDAFTVTASAGGGDVQIGNGSIPAFVSEKKNETTFRTIVAASQDLDTDSTTAVRSDLKKKNGVPLKIQMDTNVKVKMESLKSKKVGIRVTCEGIKGVVAPKGKSPTVASVSGAKCKVDLRIKIWKWTF
ncbi:NDR1/HIN1-like protein 13 [Humulus lupulus]|uniref:NDR1/HIN1-like protein 13 n=1 Tax=Humulus lupulus TaxID=3486 RepID=UPI002B401148|nr:NDR1/HIN1-like protein 13 [Humulus lupulus]